MGVLLQILGIVFSISSLITGVVSISGGSSPVTAIVLLLIGLAAVRIGRRMAGGNSSKVESGGQNETSGRYAQRQGVSEKRRSKSQMYFMKYDPHYFKSHYGRIFIIAMYVQIVISIISFILFLTPFKGMIIAIVATVGVLTFILILPITFCYYIRFKHQAERQIQWIKDGKLYVNRCFDNGYTAGGFVRHEAEIIFDIISSIQVTKRYIIVKGDIQIVDKFNGIVREKRVEKYAIPRCFLGEEHLLQLGGIN